MVGLANKLLEMLELNKKRYSGEDVKNVVESIIAVENLEFVKENDKDKDVMQKVMKEWMVGGEQ